MADQVLEQFPFTLLPEEERQRLQQRMDLAYFEKDDIIIEAGKPSEYVYVIDKGVVAELDMSAPPSRARIGLYTNGDVFGAISVLNGRSRYRFQAEQQALCHLIPVKLFLELCEQHESWGDHFRQRLTEKSRRLAEQREGGVTMAGFMLARVDACMREPLVMQPQSTLRDAVMALKQRGVDSVMVELDGVHGIVTKTDLLTALALKNATLDSPLAEYAERELVTVAAHEYLFAALVQMTRHKVARVIVMDRGRMVGVVELTDVLSYFSSRSYVVGMEIEKADTLDALVAASARLPELTDALLAQGVKMQFAMDLLAALNGRLMSKAWELVVPREHQYSGALMVLGSEGRGEQILKTDQDNALILGEGADWPDHHQHMLRFSDTLLSLGYPPCPGQVMVSNPMWCGALPEWRTRIHRWADEANTLQLAIVTDMHGIAGDVSLVDRLRDVLFERVSRDDMLLSHYARPVLSFATPLNLFGSLKKPQHGINIKKAGIFPLVHGVRALALGQRIPETSTRARLQALVARGQMEANVAEDLGEALELFSELRLQQQLRRLQGEDADLKDNHIVVQRLSSLERDLLREALQLVNDFKQRISRHFHLEY